MSVLLAASAAQAVATGGYEIGAGRTVPTSAAVLALIGVILGARVLIRPGAAGRTTVALTALALGMISAAVGGLHWANSAGGLGTGNGLAGAIAAVALGLVGVLLGGLALSRSHHTG